MRSYPDSFREGVMSAGAIFRTDYFKLISLVVEAPLVAASAVECIFVITS